MPAPTGRPRVCVITLGGTIASVPDSAGRDAVPRLSAEELVSSVPLVDEVAELDLQTFRQCPSGDLTLDDAVELAGLVNGSAEQYDGIVITQGTDTLEESAYVLDQLVRTEVPVVLTGAMRNAGLPGADGPANLLGSVRVAASEVARGLGVLVVFADQIHLARFVRKVATSSVAAFESPNLGPVGWVTEDRVRVQARPQDRSPAVRTEDLDRPVPPVGIIKLGMGAAPPRQAHVEGMAGLVVEVFGGGHVPGYLVEQLVEIDRSIPVVFASRTGSGELYRSTYRFPGSERDLLERGLVSAGHLDGLKARLLLSLLLASGADRDDIAAAFARADE